MPESEESKLIAARRMLAEVQRHASYDKPRERLVILGAGASVEAGVPAGPELHAMFMARSDLPLYKHVTRRLGINPPDVERNFRALDHLADRARHSTVAADVELIERGRQHQSLPGDPLAEIAIIRTLLRESLWLPQDLLRAVSNKPGPADYLKPLAAASLDTTVVTLNYDNTFELAAGFNVLTYDPRGGNRVLVPKENSKKVRLLKLHGSLDWQQMDDDVFKDGKPTGNEQYEPAIIFGSGNKLRHYGPFLDLMHNFKEALLRSRYVITIGYGFRDDHVDEAIRMWASIPHEDGGTKTLDICSGPEGTTRPPIVKGLLAHNHMAVNLHPEPASKYIAKSFSAPTP